MIRQTAEDCSSASSNPLAERSKFRKRLSWVWGKARQLLFNRYVGFSIFMVALSEVLSRKSQLSAIPAHLRIEGPLLLGIYWTLSFGLRRRTLAPFVAGLPIVVFYVGAEIFYSAWGNVFKAIDAQNLPELLRVLPWVGKTAVLAGLGLPIALVVFYFDYKRYWRVLVTLALGTLLVGTLELRPKAMLSGLGRVGLDVAEWSDAETVNRNGRFTSMLFFEARRRQNLAEAGNFLGGDYDTEIQATAEFLRRHGNHRNVHLVVLESFLDPTLLQAVTFSRDPRHPDFAKLFGDKQNISISPVFGGETAQAEFEALCGAPALQKLSEIEFDNFSGQAAGCMPGILSKAGYLTSVSNAFEPNYFNSTKAYTGIGFEKIYFPLEYGSANSTYLTARNVSESESYMFDGDLFDQNLGYVARTLHDNPGRPILNYVLGIYGHEPHDIDLDQRPLVLSVTSGQKDEQLLRAANQYWYRTQAIARYVRALQKLDPKSLIIIVSDHVPPLANFVKSYSEYRYLNNIEDNAHMNRILIVENGKVVRHKTIHHYEIPSVIYDYLTSKEFCTVKHCQLSDDEREQKYMSIMARAVGRQ